ncbi:MAG: hypothetical protein QNJ53_22920 [Pleurocapsa sp. MO_192.B19]|nr:hypothetical protein [Pleurocapsa sp. MO_192.B19]
MAELRSRVGANGPSGSTLLTKVAYGGKPKGSYFVIFFGTPFLQEGVWAAAEDAIAALKGAFAGLTE